MKYIFSFLLIIVFAYSCSNHDSNKRDHVENHDSTIFGNIQKKSEWELLLNDAIQIDSILSEGKLLNSSINYYLEGDDFPKLNIFHEKKNVICLRYPVFGITGDFSGYSDIFFNQLGKPFALINLDKNGNRIGDETLLFNIDDGRFCKILLRKNYQLKESKAYKNLNYQCEIVKNVDNLIHRFTSSLVYSPAKCLNSEKYWDFEVISDSIPIFKTSECKEVINYVQEGTMLKYLEALKNTFYEKDFYLVKMKVEKSKTTGWIKCNSTDLMSVSELD